VFAAVESETARLSPEERRQIEAAVPGKASAIPKATRRLLVVTLDRWNGEIRKGHASVAHGNYAIALMGERTGAYQPEFSNDVAMFKPDNLRRFDAVCFNNTTGVLFDEQELRQSLLDFVAGGKGFVGIHAAGATFVQWPEYDQWPAFGEMLGGYENGGHPWKPHETISLKLDDPAHPVNAAFGGNPFDISDEVFQFQAPYSRAKVRVLLSIDTEKTDMNPRRRFLPERLADRDFAISWVKSYGNGRVFYSALGHNPHVFWNGRVLQHFLAGIQFALGDLAADVVPSGTKAAAPDGVESQEHEIEVLRR
jgi:type 1 glutamine amidotransferase